MRTIRRAGLALLLIISAGLLVLPLLGQNVPANAPAAGLEQAAAEGSAETGEAAGDGVVEWDTVPPIIFIALAASLIALFFAWHFHHTMMKADEGNPRMREIAGYVREGAYAYLKRQYKVVGAVFACVTVIFAILAYGLKVQNEFVPFAFLTGGFFSALAGFIGMKSATQASARTAQGCLRSLNCGLQIAFRSGAVMGLTVVGLALLDITLWYLILNLVYADAGIPLVDKMVVITTTMLTFGMGTSLQALFARVGGGIYTKAADVGADLVGKIEKGIPEDDPRNPATIADNVGDNVGDVAGMGADLYESFASAILATAALGAAIWRTIEGGPGGVNPVNAVLAPLIIAGIGTLLSVLGIYLVRTRSEKATQKQLLSALSRGVNISSLLIAVASFFVIAYLLPNNPGIFGSVLTGLLAGIIIGKTTEYFTSDSYTPTQKVAQTAETGPATVVLSGISLGMISSAVPVFTTVAAILCSFGFAGGFGDPTLGLYGVAIAAVGMLSTLGITLATDAFGPIADNAGGNAEMSGLDKKVRERTDALDSLGNTTAATGKGFAIGSAALTALALIAAYIEEVRYSIGHLMNAEVLPGTAIPLATAKLSDFIAYFELTILNPFVLAGIFIGAVMAFVFSGLAVNAVSKAAKSMVEEVRRQFREKPGIMQGKDKPDYGACVYISTRGAQHAMILPVFLVLITPIVVGLFMGVAGVIGLLVGCLATSFVLAIFQANAGGAWDNAKKYIEKGHLGGKGSDSHKAAVVGDTVGDPFKDTSGPCLNTLIKLMSMVGVVTAGVVTIYSPKIMAWLGLAKLGE